MVDAVKLLKKLKVGTRDKLTLQLSDDIENHKTVCFRGEPEDRLINHDGLNSVDETLTLSSDSNERRLVIDLIPRTINWDMESFKHDNTFVDKLSNIVMLENISGSWASGNGATIWDCSIALTRYLLCTQLPYMKGKRVLELGSGLGLPSIALARVGCEMVTSERCIMIDLLSENIAYNGGPDYWQESVYRTYQYQQHDKVMKSDIEDTDSTLPNCKITHTNQRKTNTSYLIPPNTISLNWEKFSDADETYQTSIDYTDKNATSPMNSSLNNKHYLKTFDCVIGCDLIFARNQSSWEGLANILSITLEGGRSVDDDREKRFLERVIINDSTDDENDNNDVIVDAQYNIKKEKYIENVTRNCAVGFLAYEPRDPFVFTTFFDGLLKDRHIKYERVYDSSLKFDDIEIYRLWYEKELVTR